MYEQATIFGGACSIIYCTDVFQTNRIMWYIDEDNETRAFSSLSDIMQRVIFDEAKHIIY